MEFRSQQIPGFPYAAQTDRFLAGAAQRDGTPGATHAIPASGVQAFSQSITLSPQMLFGDALMLKFAQLAFFPADTSGQLEITDADIGLVFAGDGACSVAVPYSTYATPRGALIIAQGYEFDVLASDIAKFAGDPLPGSLVLTGTCTVLNLDGAAAHSASLFMNAAWRMLHGFAE